MTANERILQRASAIWQAIAANDYAVIGLSLFGASQISFWSFCAWFPKGIVFFIDSNFIFQFYLKLFHSSIISFVGVSVFILTTALVFYFSPIWIYRWRRVRSIRRLIERNTSEIRVFLFVVIFLVAFSGFYAFFAVGIFWLVFVFFRLQYFRNEKRKVEKELPAMDELRKFTELSIIGKIKNSDHDEILRKLQWAREVGKRHNRSLRSIERQRRMQPSIKALWLTLFFGFLGISHGYHLSRSGAEILLSGGEVRGVVVGASSNHIILFERETNRILAISNDSSPEIELLR